MDCPLRFTYRSHTMDALVRRDFPELSKEINQQREKVYNVCFPVFQSLIQDPKYDLSSAEYSMWVSYRRKSQVICISPRITNCQTNHLLYFGNVIIHSLKEEMKKTTDWDNDIVKSFQITTSIFNTNGKQLPEKSYSFCLH